MGVFLLCYYDIYTKFNKNSSVKPPITTLTTTTAIPATHLPKQKK